MQARVVLACPDTTNGPFDTVIGTLDVLKKPGAIKQHRTDHPRHAVEALRTGDNPIQLDLAEVWEGEASIRDRSQHTDPPESA